MLIGYARVSTDDQTLTPQREALHAAGCKEIFEERASGALRARPQLALALANIRPGDTLIVTKIDRLARSLSHLLDIIESLTAAGAHFRSISDPIDTTGPSGRLVLQMLGAVAEFERALIRERTRAGLKSARAKGRVGGNPGLKNRDPATLAKIRRARRTTRLADLLPGAEEWLPTVRRLRPQISWPAVLIEVNNALPAGRRPFTRSRLISAVRLLVAQHLTDPRLLGRAPRQRNRKRDHARHAAIQAAAAIVAGRPDITLKNLAAELTRLRHLPPRGGITWAPSSVKALLESARAAGLLAPPRLQPDPSTAQ
jgi:DNA invertase Pin-like site-specific DNA recombinase